MNKEELISELLFPHARHTIPYSTGQCSLYSKLVVTCDNGELLDGLPKVIQDSNKGLDAVDELTTVPESHGNDVGYTSNCVLQLDSTTPHGQADVGISNVCVASGQSPARFQRSQPVIAQNSGELSDGSLVKTHASNKCLDTGNELINVPAYLDNDPGCRSNCVPQSSPQDQTDVRISNIYKAPDQSLARIHRSKSRQKALELRTNAKAARKSRFSHENNTISFSGRIDLQEPDHANELSKMVKVSDINRGSFAARDAKGGSLSNEIGTSSYFGRITRSRNTCKQPSSTNEPLKLDGSYELVRKDGDISRESCVTRQAKGIEKSKENGTSSYCDRITRSKSSCIQHICLSESLELGRSSRIARKDGCTLAQPMANNPQYVSEVLEAVIPFDVSGGTSRVREAAMGYCEDREQGSDKYFGRITRSMSSSRQPSSVNDSVQLDASFSISKVDGGALGQSTGKSNQHLDKANEILEAVKPSGELGDRMKRLSTTCSSEGPSLHVESSSIADLGVTRSRSGATEKYPLVSSLNSFEGYALKNVSGCKLIQPCPETDAIVNQEENVQSSVATELVIDGPIESYPYCFESNLDGVDPRIGSEGFIVRSTSDAHMDLKPKQLDFYNMENCDLNETFSPPSQNKSPEKSSQRICCNSLELATSLDKLTYPSNVSLEKQSIGRREASSETQEAWRPFEVNTEECDENERNRSRPNMSENPLVNYAENDSEAFVYICNSPALHEPDVALSDVRKSSDVDMRLTEGCPELYIEEVIVSICFTL